MAKADTIQTLVLSIPQGGVHKRFSYSRQPVNTTVHAVNSRAFSQDDHRRRGGPRQGISKYISTQISSTGRIQDLREAVVSVTDAS